MSKNLSELFPPGGGVSGGIGEAPENGVQYARKDAAWEPVSAVHVSDDEPATPVTGQLWYKPTDDEMYVYDGSDWRSFGSGGSGGDGGGGVGDDNWGDTVLLLDGDTGPNGANNNFFGDSSPNNHAITVNGTVAQGSFSPYGTKSDSPHDITTDGGSAYFGGSAGDYLSADNQNIGNFGTADFTVEGWFNLTANPTGYISLCETRTTAGGLGPAGWALGIDVNRKFYIFSGGELVATTNGAIEVGEWYHWAYTRESGTHRLFLQGSLIGSSTTSRTYTENNFRVGANLVGLEPFPGYESDVRVVKGTAVYTSEFTPPTSPLTAIPNTEALLSFQDAGIYDRAGKNNLSTVGNARIDTTEKKYGTGSIKFGGSGDYLLSTSESSLHAFGTGDFTIEMWIHPMHLTSQQGGTVIFYDQRPLSTDGDYPLIYMESGQLRYFVANADRITGSTLSANTWYHVAVCRSGTNTKMFLNGNQDGSTYSDPTNYLNGTDRPAIATRGHSPGSNTFRGYIDDLRITRGVARYTTDFTPPPMLLPNAKALLAEREKQMALTRGEVIDETPDPKYVPYIPSEETDQITGVEFPDNDIDFDNDVTTEE